MDGTVALLKDVKIGDYFKRKGTSKTVWMRGSYDRPSRTYSCLDTEDICREIFLKGSTEVFIGFTY